MKIEMSPSFYRGSKKCLKRGWDLKLLDSILKSYTSKGYFTREEIVKYHDHALKGKWEGHREFHPKVRRHN